MLTTLRPEPINHWSALTEAEQDQTLQSLSLVFNRTERVILCTRYKYALKPRSRTVSKHLREYHSVTAGARKGLDKFIQSLILSDPEKLGARTDGCEPQLHLAVHTSYAYSNCRYKTTSLELMDQHFSKTHAAG